MSTPKVTFDEPSEFHYANAFRTYNTRTEVIVEFARSRPAKAGEPLSAHGLVGIVLNIDSAKGLIEQIQNAIQAAESVTGATIITVPNP